MYFMVLVSSVNSQYIYSPSCIPDGIGAWLERNALPLIVAHRCPGIEALHKPCDWLGHAGRSYAELFGLKIRSQQEISRILASRHQVQFELRYSEPWRRQIDALNCSKYADVVAVTKRDPLFGEFDFDFNDWMHLHMRPLPSIRKLLALRPPRCRLRVGVHFRAGDVYRGLDGADFRTAPLRYIQQQLTLLSVCVTSLGGKPSIIHLFTELTTENAALLAERLPGVNILFNTPDELTHLALAANSDVLVVGLSGFSWIMSLVNDDPVVIVYKDGAHKFKRYAHMTTDIALNDTFCESSIAPRLRGRCE